jgi:hypothetical protein
MIAVYLAVFRNWKPYLSPGELGCVKVMATDRRQARTIHRYARALLTQVPHLAALVERETEDEILLTNGIIIEVQTASFRSVRSYTVIAALCDEQAFWRSEESSANPDSEIIAALRPTMATIPGAMLLGASSPYARRGELWHAYRECYGHDDAPALVWHAPTRTMNPTVPQRVIDAATARDPVAAAAEYGAQFRTDIETFISREVIDAAVAPGRRELPPVPGVVYAGFVDPSGAGADSFTMAIAHRDQSGRAVLDAVREIRPPFSPEAVTQEFAQLLKTYRIATVRGDRYGGEYPRERFRAHGIAYQTSEKNKSELYLEMLPALNSGTVELLDNPRLIAQLAGLERRTSRVGKDSVDHAPGGHDDLINSVAGALVNATSHQPMIISAEVMQIARARDHARRAGFAPPRGWRPGQPLIRFH